MKLHLLDYYLNQDLYLNSILINNSKLNKLKLVIILVFNINRCCTKYLNEIKQKIKAS